MKSAGIRRNGSGHPAGAAARLARLWNERREPESAAPRDALRLAETLAARDGTPTAFLALAWRTVEAIFETLGWPLPTSPELARCRSAALSARQTTLTTIEQTVAALPSRSEDVLLLGELGLAIGALGVPDVLPARGTLLVRLGQDRARDVSATAMKTGKGVRWASPGRLASLVSSACTPFHLNGRRVLVPGPALVSALTAAGCTAGAPLERALFAVAWTRLTSESPAADHETLTVTGARDAVRAAAWSLGIGPRPGIVTRLRVLFRTAGRPLAHHA